MSPTWSDSEATTPGGQNRDFDDAEKGLYNNIESLPVLPSPAHHADEKMPSHQHLENRPGHVSPGKESNSTLTPSSSVPKLSAPSSGCLTPMKPVEPSPPEKKKPQRPKPKYSRWIRFRFWYNTYRQFFTFITLLNLVGIIMAAVGRFPYAVNHLGALVLGNLLCAILFRNELWMRFLYMVAIYGLRGWAPLRLKLAATSILQHVGGIHSGCAVSGTAWLVYTVVDVALESPLQHGAVIATGVITATFVIVSALSAFPWVRNNHHNTFERHHRFIGWLGLAATWTFVILSNTYDIRAGEWRSDTWAMLNAQELWFAVFMTIFIAIPWFTLREVPVEVEIPSPKVAVLRFQRGMQQGLLGRISRTSVMEYHAFGIISEGRKAPCHYMICGVQGDFTKGLVDNPPKTVWTRELKFAGVGHASAMFKRGIRVCTGTGIGAALSTCIQSPNWFLIWIGSDQERTFGPTIAGLIHNNIEPERMILWDTKKRGGRPDSMQLLRDTWKSWGAEVIFITSNKIGNDEMMLGCLQEGLHAFGTLWDF